MKHFLLLLFTTLSFLALMFSCSDEPWSESKTYTVSYYGNGATEGSVEPQKATENTSVAIKDGISFIYKCHTFIKWNTESDGSGKAYSPGAEYIIKGNLSLFAQWQETHDIITVSSQTPTCTDMGWNEYTKCTREGCPYKVGYVEIPATGHSYSTEWSVDLTSHWHKAICEHTTLKEDEGNHNWNDENICTVCETKNAGDSSIEIDTPITRTLSIEVMLSEGTYTFTSVLSPNVSDSTYEWYLDGVLVSTDSSWITELDLKSAIHIIELKAYVDNISYSSQLLTDNISQDS